jgi:hypothetical protein
MPSSFSLITTVNVVGFGRDIQGPVAEVVAARETGLVLRVVDVGVGHLAVGQGVDTTVEGAFAVAVLAAAGARVALGRPADDTHGGGSWPVFLGGW